MAGEKPRDDYSQSKADAAVLQSLNDEADVYLSTWLLVSQDCAMSGASLIFAIRNGSRINGAQHHQPDSAIAVTNAEYSCLGHY